jgi:hypothetical protein
MAKGQHLSHHQQGIVKRYYEHADSQTILKLQELVSELYLCTDPKKQQKMWTKARESLAKSGVNNARIDKVIADHNIEALARLVSELSAAKK